MCFVFFGLLESTAANGTVDRGLLQIISKEKNGNHVPPLLSRLSKEKTRPSPLNSNHFLAHAGGKELWLDGGALLFKVFYLPLAA